MKKIKGPKLSPVHPSVHPHNTRPSGAIGVGLLLDPEGRLKGGGGLISERIFIKEIPIKMNGHKKIKN